MPLLQTSRSLSFSPLHSEKNKNGMVLWVRFPQASAHMTRNQILATPSDRYAKEKLNEKKQPRKPTRVLRQVGHRFEWFSHNFNIGKIYNNLVKRLSNSYFGQLLSAFKNWTCANTLIYTKLYVLPTNTNILVSNYANVSNTSRETDKQSSNSGLVHSIHFCTNVLSFFFFF